jgi:hypothetical protein
VRRCGDLIGVDKKAHGARAGGRKTDFFNVGDRLSLTPRFSGVAGELRAWETVSTVSPTRALETVKTV